MSLKDNLKSSYIEQYRLLNNNVLYHIMLHWIKNLSSIWDFSSKTSEGLTHQESSLGNKKVLLLSKLFVIL